MSIIRIGLAETDKFAEGYSAIFGAKKKKDHQEMAAAPAPRGKKPAKKKTAKKKSKK